MERGQTPQRGAGLRVGRSISCHLHSLKAPCLRTAAQDARAIHCSQLEKVLSKSLCYSVGRM